MGHSYEVSQCLMLLLSEKERGIHHKEGREEGDDL